MHTRVDIHRNDTVKIIAGRGKNAKDNKRVLAVFPNDGKLLVEGAKLVKKHLSSKRTRNQSGIAEHESRIAISNVMVVCPSCSKPTRVAHDKKADRSIRVCKRCDAPLDK
jgi:large subunit ribosomal protein L24